MTVVVGYVPSQTGFAAVLEAEREARSRDVAVLIVNVVGPEGYVEPTAADERDLEAVAAHLNDRGTRHSVRSVSSDDPPAGIILDVAREVNASLIVLGLHRRSWIAKRVLGSTAQAVVLAAPCAVLIVPDADRHGDQPGSTDIGAPPLRSMGQTPEWHRRDPG